MRSLCFRIWHGTEHQHSGRFWASLCASLRLMTRSLVVADVGAFIVRVGLWGTIYTIL